MKRLPLYLLLIVILMISSLSACSLNEVKPVVSPTSPVGTPSEIPSVFPPTWTLTPTLLTSSATRTLAASATSSTQPATQTLSSITPTGTPQLRTTGDSAAFVSDVTIPDGTIFRPGEPFTKTWRLSNNGSTTWTTNYSLVYVRGSLMGSAPAVNLPTEVPSGKSIDLSLNFTAPAAGGQYTSFWMLKNSSSHLFGIGPNANEPFFVLINVSSSITGTVTQTTTTPGSMTATAATLSVDKTDYSGSCPVTINLTGMIATTGIGIVTYQLEAGSTTPGFTFTLPGAQTETYSSAGSHTLPLSYFLEISSSVNGWARLYISAPNTLRSTQVDFAITCK
jgi:hypothetical protein